MIKGGYIIVARKILDSEIMDKPPLYSKLWLWMLNKAKFSCNDNALERGQFKTSINEMREAMSWKVGYRKVTPTSKEIRNPYEWLLKGTMIDTMKVTGGMVITILNYDKYQTPKNYEGHSEGRNDNTAKVIQGAHLINNKNDKNIKEEKTSPQKPGEDIEKEVYKTAKGKSLTGNRLSSFKKFWTDFGDFRGKAAAADSWLDIPVLTNSLVDQICAAAKIENARGEEIKAKGGSRKMAQGWLSGRRWEDEIYQQSPSQNGGTPEDILKKYNIGVNHEA